MKILIEKTIILRPHHLLCLPGYKGKNYSKKAKSNWDNITEMLKENPNTKVKFYMGKDILCLKCPAKESKNAYCKESYTGFLDKQIKDLLKLKEHTEYVYQEIQKQLRNILDEKKHAKICGDCFWRLEGLCKNTFKK